MTWAFISPEMGTPSVPTYFSLEYESKGPQLLRNPKHKTFTPKPQTLTTIDGRKPAKPRASGSLKGHAPKLKNP